MIACSALCTTEAAARGPLPEHVPAAVLRSALGPHRLPGHLRHGENHVWRRQGE